MKKGLSQEDGLSPAIAFHENLASSWEDKYASRSFKSRERVFGEAINRFAAANEYWLDAGCGTGVFSRLLALQGCRVRGVDAAPAMVAVAAERARREGQAERASFEVVATIERLAYPPRTFDGIICSSVLEYVGDPGLCLRGFANVLRPSGTLLISVPNRRSVVRRLLQFAHAGTSTVLRKPWPPYLNHSRHAYDENTFTQLLRDNGFAPVSVTYFGGAALPGLESLRAIGSLMLVAATRAP